METLVIIMCLGAATVLYLGRQSKELKQEKPPTGSFVRMEETRFIQSVKPNGNYVLFLDGAYTEALGPAGLATDDAVIVFKWQGHDPLADSDEFYKVEPAN